MNPERVDPPDERLTVRIPTAMNMLGLSRARFYKLMDSGEVETIKVGRARLVILQSLRDFVNRQRERG
jgi:predicted DNA-binding transcriptional regulator AlpA